MWPCALVGRFILDPEQVSVWMLLRFNFHLRHREWVEAFYANDGGAAVIKTCALCYEIVINLSRAVDQTSGVLYFVISNYRQECSRGEIVDR